MADHVFAAFKARDVPLIYLDVLNGAFSSFAIGIYTWPAVSDVPYVSVTSLMTTLSRQKSTSCVSFACGIPLPELDDSPVSPLNGPRRRATDSVSASNLPTNTHKGKVPYITGKTLCLLLDGFYSDLFDSIVVVDARFKYEFDGGHIRDAVNITDPVELKSLYFASLNPRCVFVFHCEFSQVRGPSLAGFFREIDRSINVYPRLHYPDVYILDGGYSVFYRKFGGWCKGGYTRMFDQKARESGELIRANAIWKEQLAAARRQLSEEFGDENACQRRVDPVSPKMPRRRFISCADE
jgi:M-phase inducer tyrosine phosphatase